MILVGLGALSLVALYANRNKVSILPPVIGVVQNTAQKVCNVVSHPYTIFGYWGELLLAKSVPYVYPQISSTLTGIHPSLTLENTTVEWISTCTPYDYIVPYLPDEPKIMSEAWTSLQSIEGTALVTATAQTIGNGLKSLISITLEVIFSTAVEVVGKTAESSLRSLTWTLIRSPVVWGGLSVFLSYTAAQTKIGGEFIAKRILKIPGGGPKKEEHTLKLEMSSQTQKNIETLVKNTFYKPSILDRILKIFSSQAPKQPTPPVNA